MRGQTGFAGRVAHLLQSPVTHVMREFVGDVSGEFRSGNSTPLTPETADHSVATRLPTAKEWIPLPVREVYLAQVATAPTPEALDALLRQARKRYLGLSLGDLFAAANQRRHELEG